MRVVAMTDQKSYGVLIIRYLDFADFALPEQTALPTVPDLLPKPGRWDLPGQIVIETEREHELFGITTIGSVPARDGDDTPSTRPSPPDGIS